MPATRKRCNKSKPCPRPPAEPAVLCRVCLKPLATAAHQRNLFEPCDNSVSLADTMVTCFGIKVSEGDQLPQVCCKPCARDLNTTLQIRLRCLDSDARLRKMVPNTSVKMECTDTPAEVGSAEDDLDDGDDGDAYSTVDPKPEPYDAAGSDAQSSSPPTVADDQPEDNRVGFLCCACNNTFESSADRDKHAETAHGHLAGSDCGPLQCKVCREQFKNQRGLNQHLKFHDGKLSCQECNASFSNRLQLQMHRKLFHKYAGHRMKCCGCDKAFDNAAELMTHSRAVHREEPASSLDPERPYDCDICRRSFGTRKNLKRHQRRITEQKIKHQCLHCGRTFANKTILIDHEKLHTGELSLTCDLCDKQFANRDTFRKHLRLHAMPADQFKCETCGKGFRTKETLKHHLIVHSTERPLQCKHCNATFARDLCLKLHLRVHTGERPHACTMCNKRYAHSSDLKRHIMAHTGVKPFLCTFCGKRYPRKDYLRKHIALQHEVGRHPDVQVLAPNATECADTVKVEPSPT